MGVAAAFLSAILSASKDLTSKNLSSKIEGVLSSFSSFVFALPYYLVLLIILFFFGREAFTFAPMFIVFALLRSSTDTIAERVKMEAFAHGDISLVSSFLSLTPLIVLLLSSFTTHDVVTPRGFAGIVLVVVGSFFLIKKPAHGKHHVQMKGIILACAAAIFFSFNTIFDKLAVQQATPVFSGFIMTLFAAIFHIPFVMRRKTPLASLGQHQKTLWLRGLFEACFMISKLYALQFLAASYVMSIQRSSLLLSIAGGRIFFKEGDFRKRIGAGVLIFAGILLIILPA